MRNPSKRTRSVPDGTWRSSCEPARKAEPSHSATARHSVAAPGFLNIVTPTQNAESKRAAVHAVRPGPLARGVCDERARFAFSLLRAGDPLIAHSTSQVHIAETGWYNASDDKPASHRCCEHRRCRVHPHPLWSKRCYVIDVVMWTGSHAVI